MVEASYYSLRMIYPPRNKKILSPTIHILLFFSCFFPLSFSLGQTESKSNDRFFVWKYFTDMNSYERPNIEKGFTPYGKTAEKIIPEWAGTDN